MSSSGIRHRIKPGECVSSIASSRGMSWKTVWEHPENAELKRLRKNPNVLNPGDVVFVPAPQARTANAQTGAAASFVVARPSTTLKLRLVADGAPRANKKYVLVLEDGKQREGTTDGDGCVVEELPGTARAVTLRLEIPGLGTEEHRVKLGHLLPASEIRGVQQRLRHLGYHCELTGVVDEDTRSALALFQEQEGLEPTGELDDPARDKLVEAHGA